MFPGPYYDSIDNYFIKIDRYLYTLPKLLLFLIVSLYSGKKSTIIAY